MKHLIGKTVKTLKGIEEIECGPDQDQYYVVVDVQCEEPDTEHWRLDLDVKMYEQSNIPKMKKNWYDKDHVPCLSWIESGLYPDNGIETIYIEADIESRILEVVSPSEVEIKFPTVSGWYWMTEKPRNGSPEDRTSAVIVEKRDGEEFVRFTSGRQMTLSNATSWKAKFIRVNEVPVFS